MAQRKQEEAKDRDPVPDIIKLPYKDTKLLSKEGVDLDYLDLAVPSSKQEKRANSLDYLDLATSKNLNDLDVKISSPENQLVEDEIYQDAVEGQDTEISSLENQLAEKKRN